MGRSFAGSALTTFILNVTISFVCVKVCFVCSLHLLFSLSAGKMCNDQSITSRKNILIPKQCSFDFKLFCKFSYFFLKESTNIFLESCPLLSVEYKNVTVLNCMRNSKSIS